MRVVRARGGEGWELWDGARFVGHFHTNRQAWNAADKLGGEAITRSEGIAEWLSKRNGNEP